MSTDPVTNKQASRASSASSASVYLLLKVIRHTFDVIV